MQSHRIQVIAFARRKFRSGVTIAAVPIGLQLAAAALIWTDANSFPNADKSFEHPAFWVAQIILLCIAVGGNTLLDFIVLPSRQGMNWANVIDMFFCFSIIMATVIVSMLNSHISFVWFCSIFIFGAAVLFLSYRIELEIALSSAGLL